MTPTPASQAGCWGSLVWSIRFGLPAGKGERLLDTLGGEAQAPLAGYGGVRLRRRGGEARATTGGGGAGPSSTSTSSSLAE